MAQYTKDGRKIVDIDGPKQGRLFSYGQDGNGKGDAPRTGFDRTLYGTNYDKIDWSK
jgi:hypothetical protein